MTGKQKCAILRQIRSEIARQNDISFVVSECKHQGNCSGTCPKCEYEVKILENELVKRRAKGLKTVIAGISAGLVATNLMACNDPTEIELQGDMSYDLYISQKESKKENAENDALMTLEGDIAIEKTNE